MNDPLATTAVGYCVDADDPAIAVITMRHAPVNSLGHALRDGVARALARAQADPRVRAVVLTGNGRAFSAGADVTEFGTPLQRAEPALPTLLALIEDSAKPVVAAIDGLALGGGLELALVCHARVARGSARVGLPEITLGLIPGAGGTQRLPRLAGIDTALAMVLGGQPQKAAALAASGLFDEVVTDEAVAGAGEVTAKPTADAAPDATPDALLAAARRVAQALLQRGPPWPRAQDRALDAAALAAAISAQRDRLTPRQRLQPAHAAALDAVAAAALPIDAGLQRERDLFLALVPTTAAKALRYQFKAEREAAKLPPALQAQAAADLPRIDSVAVIGAGTMGTGIAICALDAGLQVLLLEQDEAALQRGAARIAEHYAQRVAAGKLDAARAAANQQRLLATTDWAALAQADLVIEAVFEELAVKREVFARIDAIARPGALLASNTSSLDIDAIAAATTRPQDVLGLHFFSPAQVMKLLEVVRGAASSPRALAAGMALGTRLGKLPVLCGNGFGFIGNRIYNAWRRQCEFMLEEGAWPEQVDAALTGFGFAMGPFAVADLSGLDIAWRMRKSQAATRDPRERYVAILDQLCEQGRLGRKAGAGYYRYDAAGKQDRQSDATVRALIEAASTQRGIERRSFTADEIVRRVLVAMVNEAALLMAEGIAARASDIDVVLVQGYGFPRWQGGPVFWAREQPREALEAELEALAAITGHGARRGDAGLLLSA